MNLTEAREKVEALQGLYSDADKPMVFKSDVLAILGEDEEQYRRTYHNRDPGDIDCDYHVTNERKGQRRVKIQRYYDDILQGHGSEAPSYGRRIGKDRRHE